jgi:predicted ArsR family transcriptional regulator
MNNLPCMTHTERQARANEKRVRLINFLASGEVWTSTQHAAKVMHVSRPVALQTLKALNKEKAIISEQHLIDGRVQKIWGITSHGLAIAETTGSLSCFQMGKTNPNS